MIAGKICCALLLTALAVSCEAEQGIVVEIRNPTPVARRSEVVELPLADISRRLHVAIGTPLVARVHGLNEELPTQIYASEVDGRPDQLLVLVDLSPAQRTKLDIDAVPEAPKFEPRVQGRLVPERMDDFAWENDLVAYRVYGPALQATGEIASGIDVWSKRVPDFITKSWYKRDREGARTHNPELSYHRDNGQGLDSYEVGSSRGCGGTAAYVNGVFYSSKNFTSARILASGPIRLDFLLEYDPWSVGGGTVRELKRITLDAGSRLNRMRSTFRFEGAVNDSTTVTVAAGIAMHKDATLHQPGSAIASVWDTPQLASAGRIGTALVVPSNEKARFTSLPMQGNVAGNAFFLFDIKSGETIDYYAGSAWSQGGTPTQGDFDRDLKQKKIRLDQTVTYRWIGARK